MTENTVDPTAMGLFFVAVVSLPLALYNLFDGLGDWDLGLLFTVGGLLILSVSFKANKAGSNFGYIVFGLVGYGVLMVGICAFFGHAIGNYVMLTFALVYILAVIWSVIIRTFRMLTLLLVTTALVFATVGLSGIFPNFGSWGLVIGLCALLNFAFNLYLAYSLALEGKLKCI